jgi:hypothetical protein
VFPLPVFDLINPALFAIVAHAASKVL